MSPGCRCRGPWIGAHRYVCGAGYHRIRNRSAGRQRRPDRPRPTRPGPDARPPASVPVNLSQWPARLGLRARAMGAPRSHPSGHEPGLGMAASATAAGRDVQVGSPDRRADGDDAQRAAPRPHRRRPPRGAPYRPGRPGRGAAGASVRSLPGDRRPRAGREGRSLPHRRRPVRLEHPAAPVRGARRGRAQAPGRRAGSGRSSSRAPTTSTTAPRSTAPTTSPRSPASRRPTSSSRSSPRRRRRSTCRCSTRSSTAGSSRRSARRRARSPGSSAASGGRTWRIGLIHGSLLIAGRTEHDDVVFTAEEIAASGLDYLALGHWHSALEGKAGAVDLRLLRARRSRSPSTRTGPARRSS